MDYKAIINLMKEMNQTELTKLEIEEEGVRICMEKAAACTQENINPQLGFAGNSMPYPVYTQPMNLNPIASLQVPGSQASSASVTASSSVTAGEEQPSEEVNHKKVVSPMVGTFYSQASPDKPPFVKVGDKVKKGQTVCIIEAMKLMNEIESEHDGEIVKILINNEDMVEFGQPLFLIK